MDSKPADTAPGGGGAVAVTWSTAALFRTLNEFPRG